MPFSTRMEDQERLRTSSPETEISLTRNMNHLLLALPIGTEFHLTLRLPKKRKVVIDHLAANRLNVSCPKEVVITKQKKTKE